METVFESAAALLFADPNLTEAITYTPHGKAPRTLRAIVDRMPAVQIEGTGSYRRLENQVHVDLADRADIGVTSVKDGFDTVTLKFRRGDATPTEMVVTKVLNHDQVSWKLEATK